MNETKRRIRLLRVQLKQVAVAMEDGMIRDKTYLLKHQKELKEAILRLKS